MIRRFPRHLENVKVARCTDCGRVQPILGYWGEKQERTLCHRCNEDAWEKLLADCGRLYEWWRLIGKA